MRMCRTASGSDRMPPRIEERKRLDAHDIRDSTVASGRYRSRFCKRTSGGKAEANMVHGI
jgi:hypothetical protein